VTGVAKTAILSDVHGNLEALQSVLSDAAAQGVQRFYCLGDMIGYGPNPIECLDISQSFALCLLGNHENGALLSTEGFSSQAERSTEWTRRQLLSSRDGDAQRRLEFLKHLPRVHIEGPLMFVHGSPVVPLSDYVFPEDIGNRVRMERMFCLIPQVCFQGHTHIPGVFTADGRFLQPGDLPEGFGLGQAKIMVNVGSVGQPRDGDWRACYLTMDKDWFEFRRVEYDVETTVGKIHQIPELGAFMGDRLREGK